MRKPPEGFVPIISVGTDESGDHLSVFMHHDKHVYGQVMIRTAAALGLLFQEAMNQPPVDTDNMLTFDEYWSAMGRFARRAADVSLMGDVERILASEVEST
jgi:hypothetical protein